jgi:hypothetical protein
MTPFEDGILEESVDFGISIKARQCRDGRLDKRIAKLAIYLFATCANQDDRSKKRAPRQHCSLYADRLSQNRLAEGSRGATATFTGDECRSNPSHGVKRFRTPTDIAGSVRALMKINSFKKAIEQPLDERSFG